MVEYPWGEVPMKCKVILGLLLALFLSGCSPYSAENLFAPPEIPAEYAQLNAALGEVRATGAEYVYPASGANRQAVQMFDLDTDGEDECVVFFRNPEQADEVQIYLYEYTDGKYWLYATVSGISATIERVDYADVLGVGNYELIVGFAQGGKKTLAVYEKTEETFAAQYEMPYANYIVSDLNGDGVSDLNIISGAPGEKARLSVHTAHNGRLSHFAQASLSASSEEITRVSVGNTGGMQAIFVASSFADGYVSDVVCIHDKMLKNLALGAPLYCRYPIYVTDLDGDGELEIPKTEQDPLLMKESGLWELVWCSYGADGNIKEEQCTYHCNDQNWYLSLPLSWKGKVRTEYDNSNAAVVKAKFFTEAYEPIFTFAAISGEKREALMQKEGMQQVGEQDKTVYAVSIERERYQEEVLTPEWIGANFHRRSNLWTDTGLIIS